MFVDKLYLEPKDTSTSRNNKCLKK